MRRLTGAVVIAGVVVVAVAVFAIIAAFLDSGDESTGDSVQVEGIEVHGDWRIAIYNEDGTLDGEYVFANALVPGAASVLGKLLAIDNPDYEGAASVQRWTVALGQLDTAVPGVGPCGVDFIGSPHLLNFIPGHDPNLDSGCLLGTAYDGTEPGTAPVAATPIDGGVRLGGSVVATQDGTIDFVETLLYAEGPVTGSPGLFANAFTARNYGPITDITVGQTVVLQVDITFGPQFVP